MSALVQPLYPAYPPLTVPIQPVDLNQLLDGLTIQERKILQFTLLDYSCKEISNELNVSTETIKKHRKNIIKKLGVKGKTEFRRMLRQIESHTPKIPPRFP